MLDGHEEPMVPVDITKKYIVYKYIFQICCEICKII